ncbi:MAG: hypothetical protein ACOCT9_01925 [archaeon]
MNIGIILILLLVIGLAMMMYSRENYNPSSYYDQGGWLKQDPYGYSPQCCGWGYQQFII